jgi:isochorismate synthase
MKSLHDFIGTLINQRKAFVCYRLPGTNEPELLVNGQFSEVSAENSGDCKDGFIIAPFNIAGSVPVLFYSGGDQLTGWNVIDDNQADQTVVFESRAAIPNPPCITRDEYLLKATGLIKLLRDGKLKKIVLSRVVCQPLSLKFAPGAFFRTLCLNYPNAFVYIFGNTHGLCWVGATPETLLEVENHRGYTMALAGTRAADQGLNQEKNWTSKEIEEQELVSAYIRKKLSEVGLADFEEAPLESRVAGPVVHLLKRFRFELPQGSTPLNLALRLHPTPAVCGLPQTDALQQITLTETHDRMYYGGFLGPVYPAGNARLFVNLRCMQLGNKIAYIFAGGGLLSGSDPENEWNETQAKAETLLSVIRKQNLGE